MKEIEKDFSDARIPDEPEFVSDHTQHLLDTLVAQSVHTASPSFIGHMTSALPYFLMPLSKIMIALNQNLVKIETSKAFTRWSVRFWACCIVSSTVSKIRSTNNGCTAPSTHLGLSAPAVLSPTLRPCGLPVTTH